MDKEIHIKKGKNILTIITIIWVGLVLVFAMQSVEVSNSISRLITQKIYNLFSLAGIEKQGLTPQEQIEYHNVILRKCAHLLMFIVLGILSAQSVLKTKKSQKSIKAIVFCVLIAIIGELVQLFVDGRTARIKDVLLDSIGSTIGVLLMFLYTKIQRKKYIAK